MQALDKPGPQVALSGWQLRYLGGHREENVRYQETDRLLEAAVTALRRQRWHLYEAMAPVFFEPGAGISTLDRWVASGSPGQRIQAIYCCTGIEWILDRVEDHRLSWPHEAMPAGAPKRMVRRARRERFLADYHERLALYIAEGEAPEAASGRAVREAAEIHGYGKGLSEPYRIIREARAAGARGNGEPKEE